MPPTPPPEPLLELSVRELVEFVLRRGDLGGGGFSSPLRALAGTKLHQKIQKSRPASYQKEVRLEKRLTCEGVNILLRGRIDGLVSEPDHLWLEEIKTLQSAWPPEPDPLHWGQAKIYAALYGETLPFASATLQLTYVRLHSGQIAEFREQHSFSDLQAFFQTVLASYLKWITDLEAWNRLRNSSLETVLFPHGRYRAGQRGLSVKIYHAIAREKRFFVNAPTGTGKTISALFPALKALGKGHGSKIFYLTSRTLGRLAAEKALGNLRQQGLRLRSVTLTAKNKICFNAEGAGCDVTVCPYAIGYYDRIHAATRDLLACEDISRSNIEAVARQHQVCPFELSLDASLWSDVIIGDYNYVFDPGVSLKRFFQDEPRPYVFLIDEAHHLGDRCREMFSAALHEASFSQIKKRSPDTPPGCVRAARAVARKFHLLAPEENPPGPQPVEIGGIPEEFIEALLQFTKKAESHFVEEGSSAGNEDLLGLYFEALAFLRTHDELDPHYRIWREGPAADLKVVLDCVDPSARIDRILRQGRAAVFVSATLLPLEYFARVLGARRDDPALSLDSPFDPGNFGIFIADKIAVDFKNRAATSASVAEMIHGSVRSRKGNYLAFFPSHQYLRAVAAELEKLPAFCRFLIQAPDMNEGDREAFLAEFQPGTGVPLLGLAVMGGIFGEAIDLVGDRLIGTIVVSVGLPQICFERNLTQSLFSQNGVSGFDYAYTYPGFNRVLQAVGRVIRTETDRGIAVLIDRRFSEPRYRRLIPSWWHPKKVADSRDLEHSLGEFWQNIPPSVPIRLEEPLPGA